MATRPHPSTKEPFILTQYLLTPSPLPQILSLDKFIATCVPTQYRAHPKVKRLYRDLQLQRNIDVDAVRQNIERECARASATKGRLAAAIAADADVGLAGPAQKRKRKRTESQSDDVTKNGQRYEVTAGDSEENDESSTSIMTRANEQAASAELLASSLHPAASSLPAQPTLPSTSTSTSNPPPTFTTARSKHHTTQSLLVAMQNSLQDIESETADLEQQEQNMLNQLGETVGQLSDLRYGRLKGRTRHGGEAEGDGRRHGTDQPEVQMTMEADITEGLKRLESVVRAVLDREAKNTSSTIQKDSHRA